MKYNFDKLTDRTKQNSLKWDIKENELPMWVADMDFEVAGPIVNALNNRLNQKIFGYNIIPSSWYDSIISWWERKHHYLMKKEDILFSTGVVPSISSVVRRLTLPAENVLIQTPVYNIFFNSIINNGRNVLESKLIYENNKYHIDFEDLEQKLKLPQTRLMILCNPHNPIGKIYTKEELAKIGHLCYMNNVIILVDEIHCDIVDPNKEYNVFQNINDECKYNSIMCGAPTKCFNLAGLQTSFMCIPNKDIFNRVNRGINNDEIAEPNTFAIQACEAAFNESEDWLKQMQQYIYENKIIVKNFILDNNLPVILIESEATYLLWIDCSKICLDTDELCDFIREKTGLYLSSGKQYGESGKSFIRMNIACPKTRLNDGLNRFKLGINLYLNR